MNKYIGMYSFDAEQQSRRKKNKKKQFPNLALMKLSTYFKNKDYRVELYNEEKDKNGYYDKVFVSVVFDWSLKKLPKNIPSHWEVGGYAYDINKKLPINAEHLVPDYDLFDCDSYYGFTTRGCFRNCSFCFVPKAEGKFRRYVEDINEFCPSDKGFTKITLLDNNILYDKEHFINISNQIIDKNLLVDFNQGLDHRLVCDDDILNILTKLKHREYRFSFDFIEYKNNVIKTIECLKKHGLKKNFWYVLVGYNTTIEEDLERLKILRDYKQVVYVQRYNKSKDRLLIPLAQWANQPWIFYSYTWNDFITHPSKERYRKLYEENNLPLSLESI